MKKLLLGIAALNVSFAFAGETGVTTNGTELVLNVEGVESLTYSQNFPAGLATIRKTGTGTLVLGTSANTFGGTFTVEAGLVKGPAAAYGTPATLEALAGGAVAVTDGVGLNANTLLKIAGTGPDGKGAFQHLSAADETNGNQIKKLELTADATIYANKRFQISAVLTMNGHQLSKRGPGMFCFRGGDEKLYSGGDFRVEEGVWNCECCGFVSGDGRPLSNSTFHVAKDATLMIYGQFRASSPFPLKLHFEDGAYLKAGEWSGFGEYASQDFDHLAHAVRIDGKLFFNSYNGTVKDAVWFDGGVTGSGSLQMMAGNNPQTVFFTNAQPVTVSSVCVSNSSVVVLGGKADFGVNDYFSLWRGNIANPSTLVVKDEAKFMARTAQSTIRVGDLFAGGGRTFGLMKVEGGVVSNDVYVGCDGGIGALYQTGGKIILDGKRRNQSGWSRSYIGGGGNQGYGFAAVAGGEFVDSWVDRFFIGGWSTRGIFHQTGGVVRHDNSAICLGCGNAGTYSHYRQSGGTSHWKGSLHFGKTDGESYVGLHGVLTIDGTADADMGAINICMDATSKEDGNQTAIVNFNGGRAKVGHICRWQQGTPWEQIKEKAAKCGLYYVNFNGGTLVTANDGEFFLEESRKPTRVTVWERGATVDTDGKDVTWCAPVLAPSGKGLKSVTIKEQTWLNPGALLGPSYVYVKGANGNTAEVMMDYDLATRTVTGVSVITPGIDLGDDVSVRHEDWYPWFSDKDSKACDFVLQDNPTTGGFTKKGQGELKLLAANTWGGVTRLAGGTLTFAHAQGLPAGAIEFAAEGLNANDRTTPLLVAPTLGSQTLSVTEADTLDATAYKGLKILAKFETPLAALPVVRLIGSDGQELAETGKWHAVLTDGGKTLKFGLQRGFAVFVK